MIAFLLSIPFIWIAIEDFRFRSFHLRSLILVIGSLIGLIFLEKFDFTLTNFLLNVALLISIIFCLILYLLVRHRKIPNLNKDFLGLGDILFLLIPAAVLSTNTYINYFILSSAIALVCHLLYILFFKSGDNTIPFVSYLSLIFLLYIYDIL